MRITFCAVFLSSALALVSLVSPAKADQRNKETKITINEAIEVPGAVLAPGTYILKLMDSPSNRNVVQVFSQDENGRQRLVTTIMAVSAYRLVTPDRTMIDFEERPSGKPEAIHTWFYPGDNVGWEFVYPKSERLEVAAVQPRMETATPIAAPELPTPPVAAVPVELELPAQVEQELVVTEEETLVAPPLEPESSADRFLPETAGYSASELIAGVSLLGLGLLTVFAGLRRTEA